jgi:hypothetical protein
MFDTLSPRITKECLQTTVLLARDRVFIAIQPGIRFASTRSSLLNCEGSSLNYTSMTTSSTFHHWFKAALRGIAFCAW